MAVHDPMNQMYPDQDVSVPLMIGTIGHRDLVPGEIDGLRERVSNFLVALQSKYPQLRVTLLTSLADGADRLAAAVANSLHMPITYVLPMPSALFEQDFDADSLLEYRQLTAAGDVLTLPLVDGNTADRVALPGPARDKQYARLGAFIAAHCHILLALWDGRDNDLAGGTAAVIRFHQDDFMPGFSDGEPRSRLDDTNDESDLVYHIVCSRARPGGVPMSPLKPGETWWFSRNAQSPRTTDMPARYDIVLERMVEFSQDRVRYRTLIERTPPALLQNDGSVKIDVGARAIAELFHVADWLAVRHQRLTRNALKWLCGFAAAASASFVAYADLAGNQWMICPYLLFMAAMIGTYQIASRGDWHRRYLDYRVLAEALRVQFYWAVAGVERVAHGRFGHDGFLKRQDLELGWIRNMLRIAGQTDDAHGGGAPEAGIEIALRDWVGDQDRGQLGYYRSRWPEKMRRHHVTERWGAAALGLGLMLAGWIAVAQFCFERQPPNGMVALMGLLPIGAAIRQWYAHRTAELELISQFQFMARIFANAQRQLRLASLSSERRRILRELGDAALGEHGQWILRLRERPIATLG